MPADSDATERFDELYRSLASPILAYAARRTASPHDAADVMAEAFAVAWRRIDDVPGGEGARPWMFGVARGVLANHRRGERRRRRLSDRVASELADAVRASAVSHDRASERTGRTARTDLAEGFDGSSVQGALEALDEPDRELLTLLAWDELTRAEVAQVLGCSTATLRVRLHRARSRFRSALDARDEASRTARTHGPLVLPDVPSGTKELS